MHVKTSHKSRLHHFPLSSQDRSQQYPNSSLNPETSTPRRDHHCSFDAMTFGQPAFLLLKSRQAVHQRFRQLPRLVNLRPNDFRPRLTPVPNRSTVIHNAVPTRLPQFTLCFSFTCAMCMRTLFGLCFITLLFHAMESDYHKSVIEELGLGSCMLIIRVNRTDSLRIPNRWNSALEGRVLQN